jgi:hypothetical protein
MAQNLPRGTPGRVLVLLAMLTGLVVVSAWRDALRRETLRREATQRGEGHPGIRHPTALGDAGLLDPGQLPLYLQAAGKNFTLSAGGPIYHRGDDRMFRVLTGEQAGFPFTLFSTHETISSETEPRLFARKAPHQYLRLRTRLVQAETPLGVATSPDPARQSPPPNSKAALVEDLPEAPGKAAEADPFVDEPPVALENQARLAPAAEVPSAAPGRPEPPVPVEKPAPERPIPKAVPLAPEEQDFPVKPTPRGTL